MSLYLNEVKPRTLTQVMDALDSKSETIRVANTGIKLKTGKLDKGKWVEEPEKVFEIKTIDGKDFRVPVTSGGLAALGANLKVPSAYISRMPDDLVQVTFDRMLAVSPGDRLVVFDDDGIQMVKDPGAKIIEPRRLVEKVAKVMGPESQVMQFWTGEEFRLDVVVKDGSKKGIGGDRKVGDITKGGLRVDANLKRGLAPSVQRLLWRLECTNGMEGIDSSLKVDARGETVEDVLNAFEMMADLAFRTVEDQIAAFYDLRNTPVDNPERWLRRIAREQGIPARTLESLLDRVVSDDLPDEPSMFDLVNLLTNEANNPALIRDGGRRLLQQAGGSVILDHSHRCAHCQSIVG